METFLEILKSQFVWGLALGLLIAGFIWKNAFATKLRLARDVRRLENELRELQGHLNTQLKINAQGNQKVEQETQTLREQNENLRITVATLQNKPGRAEIRQLHIMESAVRQMREQAPGFAPAWEKALRDAETDFEAAEGGLRKLVRRVMPGIGLQPSANIGTTEKTEED
ncbi:MAG: hypothetical protein MUF31_08380 [Akkermansiaceae bacterium]|jgi:hypothetical protein|nr:hypothetical protein [Akkermansiaceae bacterium]